MGILKKAKRGFKINDQIKKYMYNWIMHHPKVMKSPIVNYCLKVNIYGHTEPQLVPIFYCRCPSENFVTTLLVTQTMVDSKRQ